jgi:HEAT repeat protein
MNSRKEPGNNFRNEQLSGGKYVISHKRQMATWQVLLSLHIGLLSKRAGRIGAYERLGAFVRLFYYTLMILVVAGCSLPARAEVGGLLHHARQADVVIVGTVVEIGEDAVRVEVSQVLRGQVDAQTITVQPSAFRNGPDRHPIFFPQESVILFLRSTSADPFQIVSYGTGTVSLQVNQNDVRNTAGEVDPARVKSRIEAVKRILTLSEVQNQGIIDRVMLLWATSEHSLLRAEAQHDMPRHASDYIVSLTELVSNQDAQVRIAALYSLRSVTDKRIIPLLITASRDSNADVVQAASKALAQHDSEDAIAALIALTRHKNPEVRAQAATDLGYDTYRPQSRAAVVKMLQDTDAAVRAAAALAVANWLRTGKAEVMVPLLVEMIRDPVDDVRIGAATALRESRNPLIVGPLLEALRRPELSESLEFNAMMGLYLFALYPGHNFSPGEQSSAWKLITDNIELISMTLDRGRESPARHTIGILEKAKSPAASAALRRAAERHPDTEIRLAAQRALNRIEAAER